MFEINGRQVDLSYLQREAANLSMSIEEFKEAFGVTDFVEKTESDNTEAPSLYNHISMDDFDMGDRDGGDAEGKVVEKLKEKYKDLPYKFEESTPGLDRISVTGPNKKSETFTLKSFWNYGNQRDQQDSQYDSFIKFIEENNTSTEGEKQAFKKTGLLPQDYPTVTTQDKSTPKPRTSYGASSMGIPTSNYTNNNVKTPLTAEEVNKLADVTKNNLREIYDNPAKYGIGEAHSYDTNKLDVMMGDNREKINDTLYEQIKEKTGTKLTKDQFVKFINGSVASKGMFQTTLVEAKEKEEYWNFVKAQVDQKDKKVFETPYYKNFIDKELGIKRDDQGNVVEGEGNKNAQIKHLNVKILRKSYDKIKDLEARLDAGGADVEVLKEQIKVEEKIIKASENVIKGIALDDEELGSNYYVKQGYTQASADRIAASAKLTKNSQENNIALVKNKAGNAMLSDREAMDIHYDGLFKRYFNLQQEAKDKNIKINITTSYPSSKLSNLPGVDVSFKENLNNDTVDFTYVWEGDYATMHKNGLSSRDADGFGVLNRASGALSKEDKDWIETHDAALDDNLGARRAMFKLHELDIDPSKLEKSGFFGSMFNTGVKAFGTHFFGNTEIEADENLAKITGKTNTNRFLLDEIQEFQSDYNIQNKDKIEKGEVKSLQFTDDQKDQLARSMSENVSEGVGHFAPMLTELAVVGAITKGTGIPAALGRMIRSGSRVKKMLGHLGMVAVEEIKMQSVGFKPTSGAAFYTGGVLAQPYFNINARWNWLNNLHNKVVKAGPIGAASMELASITELAYEDFMDVKDFKAEFNDMYGDMSDVTQRLVTNSLVFGLVGAHNVKALRVKPGGKIGLGVDLMSTGAKERASLELQEAQDKILNGRKYEELSKEEKSKYDGYQETKDTFAQMVILEEMANELDTKNPEFESNFKKRYTEPFQKIIQEAVGRNEKGEFLYKGYDVRFVDGKNKNFHGGKNMSPAQFLQGGGKGGKDLIIFNKEVYNKEGYKGKEIHEMIGHAAFRAIESANPGMTLQFKKNMAQVFHKYDKQIGKSLTKDYDKAPESLKKIIDLLESGRGSEIKNEEYLAYMLEAFSNPSLYYELYATSLVKEVKANFTSFFEEMIPGYQPKIKTAEDFIGYVARLTRDIRLDVGYSNKLTRFVKDNPLSDLKVEDGRYKLNEVDLLKLDIQQNSQREALNSRDVKNELTIQKNKDLSDKLFDARKLEKEKNLDNRGSLALEGRLIANNMLLVESFVNNKFDPFKGGERSDFKQETLLEVVKLSKTYTPDKGEFGSYLIQGLYGGGGFGGGRSGAIYDRFTQGREIQTVSIDADGSFLQLEGGVSSGGSVGPRQAEAGLINLKESLKLTDKHVESIESKIDIENIEKYNYRDLLDLKPDITMEMFGGRTDVVKGESSKNSKQKSEYIAENWKTLYDLLPHGAMLKTGKSKIEGLSTMIEPSLLNGLLYNAASRKGVAAEASSSKTGKTAGLPVQNKIKNLNKTQFLEKLGIFLTPEGKVDFKQTKIKAQSKQIRAIDALISETGRAITNQVVRNYLEKPGNETVNPELRDQSARDALYNQIAGGKSELLNSNDLGKAFGTNKIQKAEQLAAMGLHERNPKAFIAKYGEQAYDRIKDLLDLSIANKALAGADAQTRFVSGVKGSEFSDVMTNHEYANMGPKEFQSKESEGLRRNYIKNSKTIFDLWPAITQNKIDGNMALMMDLVGLHNKTLGKGNAASLTKEINSLKEALTKPSTSVKGENPLPKEIIELVESIDWKSIKGAYNASNFTAWKKAAAVGGKKGREQLAEYYKENPGAKQLDVFYDAFNRTLEHWVHSGSTQKIKDNRLGHVFKLKKENSQQGTKGERNLSPGSYFWIPKQGYFNNPNIKKEVKQLVKAGGYNNAIGGFTKFKSKNFKNEAETHVFKKYSKYEHLKSSSEQSLESALLIAENMWGVEGGKSLSKYRGVYGRLAEFNMIDFIKNSKGETIDARTSNADIFRFGQNLELAKNIYSVSSKFKKTLYQEIMSSEYKQQAKNLEKIVDANRLDKILQEGRNRKKEKRGISIFDFDDTLARTNSQIIVTMPNGNKFKINATEFAKQDAKLTKQGAKYDFSEFNKVIDGKKGPLFDLAVKREGKFGNKNIFVLTARPQASAIAINKFLKGVGLEIPIENITGLENGAAKAKADWVKDKYIEGYNDFYFADDAIKNVKAVKDILQNLDVKSEVQQALMSRDLGKEFNNVLENKTGIGAEKVYSKAKGEVAGATKGKFKFWIPPTAEDFVGLIYPTLGKGKTGDAQMAWYKTNLLDPYARGENAITKERHQLMKDFHALKKEIKSVPKGLRDKLKEGAAAGYTKEQALRVYIWNKQKMEIPGISKRDLKQIDGFVKSNKDLKDFADRLMLIHKGDAYTKPGVGWLAGTITTDMIEGINTTKRKKHLQQWIENKNEIFSEANLNKYEAAYGGNARKALENILQRMESGSNRKKLGGVFQRLENEVLDWTNNSVGAIMFLNSRSAVLQTISAINYVNFKDNNPLAAAKAFGNQKQYWKDFKELFNSDYLVQRRDGLKININESEIADMSSRGGVKGAISYLLNKGFVMTRGADSFAISSGGASFYRNRINSYLKEGLSEVKAKEKAFRDFREITEESQQSSRPDRISAQQASGLGRVVLAFANTPMQYTRLQKRAIQDLANGRGDAKSNLSKIIYYGFVQNLIFNTLQQAMFAIGFDEDPDDQQQIIDKSSNMINGMLDSQLRGLGIGGAAVSTVKNVLFKLSQEHSKGNPKYENAAWETLDFAPPISSKVTKVRSAFRSLDYDLDEMKEGGFGLDNPAYMAGAQVLSATANLPVDRILKKMKNVQDAMDEDNEMWAKAALLSGWSEWELGLSDEQLEKLYDSMRPEEVRRVKSNSRTKSRRRVNVRRKKN